MAQRRARRHQHRRERRQVGGDLHPALAAEPGDRDRRRQRVGDEQHQDHRQRAVLRVLLSAHGGARDGEADGVEREAEHEPERDGARNRERAVGHLEALGQRHPGGDHHDDQRELEQADHADAQHLARDQVVGGQRRQQHLNDLARLLLDHPQQHPLAVGGDRDHQQPTPGEGHPATALLRGALRRILALADRPAGQALDGQHLLVQQPVRLLDGDAQRSQLVRQPRGVDGAVHDQREFFDLAVLEDQPLGVDEQRVDGATPQRAVGRGPRLEARRRDVDLALGLLQREPQHLAQPRLDATHEAELVTQLRVAVGEAGHGDDCADEQHHDQCGDDEALAARPLREVARGDEPDVPQRLHHRPVLTRPRPRTAPRAAAARTRSA